MAAPTSIARQKKLKKKLKKTPKLDPRCPDPEAMTVEIDYWVSAWLGCRPCPLPDMRQATTMGVWAEASPRRKSPHYARPAHHISRHRPKIQVNFIKESNAERGIIKNSIIKILAICTLVFVLLLGIVTAKGTFLVVKQGMRGAPIRLQRFAGRRSKGRDGERGSRGAGEECGRGRHRRVGK